VRTSVYGLTAGATVLAGRGVGAAAIAVAVDVRCTPDLAALGDLPPDPQALSSSATITRPSRPRRAEGRNRSMRLPIGAAGALALAAPNP
jgi:hypothetical protein